MKHINLKNNIQVLVDDEVFHELIELNWFPMNIRGYVYAARNIKKPNGVRGVEYMHRRLAGAGRGQLVDHKDTNTLNNQRYNLRLCTGSQNQANQKSRMGSSQYKGVYWSKVGKKWMAYITVNRKRLNLGYFIEEVKAAKAYDVAAREHFGVFAYTNFPEE